MNWRQRAFCDYLLLHPGNQAEAYRQAGYDSNAPERDAVALLKNASVRDYLDRERSRLIRIANFTKEDAIKFLARVIDTPVGEVDWRSPLCQEYQLVKDGYKFKMPCKLGALEKLAKMLGWNAPENVNLGTSDALTALLKEVRKK